MCSQIKIKSNQIINKWWTKYLWWIWYIHIEVFAPNTILYMYIFRLKTICNKKYFLCSFKTLLFLYKKNETFFLSNLIVFSSLITCFYFFLHQNNWMKFFHFVISFKTENFVVVFNFSFRVVNLCFGLPNRLTKKNMFLVLCSLSKQQNFLYYLIFLSVFLYFFFLCSLFII